MVSTIVPIPAPAPLRESGFFQHRFVFREEDRVRPVGNLRVFNDELLNSGQALEMVAEENSFVVLFPVKGEVELYTDGHRLSRPGNGEAQFLQVTAGEVLRISNPAQTEPVNFVQIWIRNEKKKTGQALVDFELNRFMNCLLQVSPQWLDQERLPFRLSAGIFSAGTTIVHPPAYRTAQCLFFVLEAAFEVAGRFLQARDGLLLNVATDIELKALRKDALILVLEQPVSEV